MHDQKRLAHILFVYLVSTPKSEIYIEERGSLCQILQTLVTCQDGSAQKGDEEKLGILSYRVSHEETSGTLLKIGLDIKHNYFSRQIYISTVP